MNWGGGLPGLPGVGLTLGAACAEPGYSDRSERLAAGPAVTVGAPGRGGMATPPSTHRSRRPEAADRPPWARDAVLEVMVVIPGSQVPLGLTPLPGPGYTLSFSMQVPCGKSARRSANAETTEHLLIR